MTTSVLLVSVQITQTKARLKAELDCRGQPPIAKMVLWRTNSRNRGFCQRSRASVSTLPTLNHPIQTSELMNARPPLNHLQKSAESGFTIIESLVAIIIVSILLVAIAPVLTLSVANRMQSKKVEAATKAAQGYVDSIRADTGSLAVHPPAMVKTTATFSGYAAPSGTSLTCNTANAYCTAPQKNLFCVDGNGDGKCTNTSHKDLIVQGFGYIPNGSQVANQADNVDKGFRSYKLGVRVYRADAFVTGSGTNLKKAKDGKVGSAQSTVGSIKKVAPLIEMTTDIAFDRDNANITTFRKLCTSATVTGC